MHMADALLSPAVGTTFWAGTIAAIGYASRKMKEAVDDRMVPLMGVLGAFIFAAQMINFTIPGTGSSGHLGGGMILSILLGPFAAVLVMASVLTVQAFFFADGGLLALGCNIWNLGIYPCFIVFPLVYKPLAGDGKNPKKVMIAALVSAIIGLQMGAFSVVLQTLLSGRSELPFGTFILLMQPVHLVIGIVEGFATAGVINYVRSVRPELLARDAGSGPSGEATSLKKLLITFAVIAVITGGALSWFASTHPDGLEWSIAKITGTRELSGQQQGIAPELKGIQDRTAFLPDYNFKRTEGGRNNGDEAPSWPSVETGTSVSGIVGSVSVFAVVVLIGLVVRFLRRRHT